MLVLASDGGPHNVYSLFQEQWLRYANSHPNIDCFLYKADCNLETQYDLCGNILRIKRGENWDDILSKTFDALDYFKSRAHEYDWVCRPNISAFFHFEKYLKYLSSLPDSVQAEGIHYSYGGMPYPSGSGFSFRASLVDLLLLNRRPPLYVDDITFGKIFQENGIAIHNRPSFCAVDCSNIENCVKGVVSDDWNFQYRFKTNNRADDSIHYKRIVDAVLST
jgi:hypothetical protein